MGNIKKIRSTNSHNSKTKPYTKPKLNLRRSNNKNLKKELKRVKKKTFLHVSILSFCIPEKYAVLSYRVA